VNGPALVIMLPLEGSPLVYADTLHDGEEARLLDWIAASDERAELFRRALELAERERAA
jgi:hypothetical protein